jgi:hypothetical protein
MLSFIWVKIAIGVGIGCFLLNREWFKLYYIYCLGVGIYLARCIYYSELNENAYFALFGFIFVLIIIGRALEEESGGGDYGGGSDDNSCGGYSDQPYWEDPRDS